MGGGIDHLSGMSLVYGLFLFNDITCKVSLPVFVGSPTVCFCLREDQAKAVQEILARTVRSKTELSKIAQMGRKC